MARLEIRFQRGRGEQRRIVLGRFAAAVAMLLFALFIALVVGVALVLGYLLAGVLVLVFLIALVAAAFGGALRSLRK